MRIDELSARLLQRFLQWIGYFYSDVDLGVATPRLSHLTLPLQFSFLHLEGVVDVLHACVISLSLPRTPAPVLRPPHLVWCGVVWCGVVWCGVVCFALLTCEL